MSDEDRAQWSLVCCPLLTSALQCCENALVFGRLYSVDLRNCDRKYDVESMWKTHLNGGCDWEGGVVDVVRLRCWRSRQLMTRHETAMAGKQVDCAASEVAKTTKTSQKNAMIRVVSV